MTLFEIPGVPGPSQRCSQQGRPQQVGPDPFLLGIGIEQRALRAFRLEGTEEDNPHPGVARHFWLPVDPTRRVECQCKTDETIVQEPDAYTWTNPVEGPCRGCELASMLESLGITKPCPIHAQIDNGPVTHA